MHTPQHYDAIIIGGSYSGLSAAMALGRSLKTVLLIDSGEPCNRQTPHSHNFLTQDGSTPAHISQLSKQQVLNYPTITWLDDRAIRGQHEDQVFRIRTASGHDYTSSKLLLAMGVKDQMLPIPGFADCWGISIIHCPFCHGYEVKNQPTGILANGDRAAFMAQLLANWTTDLRILTNGPSTLTIEQHATLAQAGIAVIEEHISAFEHRDGQLHSVQYQNGDNLPLPVLYAHAPNALPTDLAVQLSCTLTDEGLILVDSMQQTNIPGLYASGDCTTPLRSVANAVASGQMAGVAILKSFQFPE
ncbi:pyridine nucleotide-disulfide oxidoreductase [Reichenbachiella sp. 5M10]|uniref:NAD(P)/FAD-dependent oxidoreductase n=1 Tax=Reichenbachiella sp. 5M10 TaxID=1889772 RepID=UPI000C14A572|nr:NAD(P)/FAD-dependent oxidoreductase [Reichenbachiella sp. 5M10]PIB35984.1 pyridine nucleotide-disulfide oxidoreductase [Reichenbachiella sp. 5M10]